MRIGGTLPNGRLVEIVELPEAVHRGSWALSSIRNLNPARPIRIRYLEILLPLL